MNTTRLLFALIIIVIVSSCKKDCYRELAYEEKVRLGAKGFERLIFKNNSTGKLDTMDIGGIIKTVTPAEGKCKDEKESFSINGSFKNRLYTSFYSITFSTQIAQPKNDDSGYLFPVITTSFGQFALNAGTPRITTTINNHSVTDVYEITNTQPVADPDVDKIYFSFNHGLMKILLRNGKYWERTDI